MIRYKLKTAPKSLDILDEVKNNLRIISEDHDDLLEDLIAAAVTEAENHTGRQLLRATYLAYLDQYPGNILKITLGPVASIVAVRYYPAGAQEQAILDAADYQLDDTDLTARLLFKKSFSPDTSRLNPVEIEFTTGWVDKDAVPKDIIRALVLIVSEGFLNPQNMNLNHGSSIRTSTAIKLLRNYKIQRY